MTAVAVHTNPVAVRKTLVPTASGILASVILVSSTPVAAIPQHEMWLWQNPEALRSVRQGLNEAREGKLNDLGSFAEFVDLEIDD